MRDYVEECIESVISQRLTPESYEIICCDDLSSDDTVDVIKRASERYPDVAIRLLINEENRGVSFTRNRMIEEARGEYLWFLDGDDILMRGAAGDFADFVRTHACDVALGNYIRFTDAPPCERDVLSCTRFFRADMRALPVDLDHVRMCAVWCGIFRRQFLLKNGLRFNERMIAQEDTLFYYETECCSPVVYKTDGVCCCYRQRAASVMHVRSAERAKNYYLAMREMLRVYESYRACDRAPDAEQLDDKIRHSEHNVIACLSAIPDTAYVRDELNRLRKEQRYPGRFYRPILKRGFLRNLLPFLNPIPMFFWINHYLYKIKYSLRQ